MDIAVADPHEDQVPAPGGEAGMVVLKHPVDTGLRQPPHAAAVQVGGVEDGRPGRLVDLVEGPNDSGEDDTPPARSPTGIKVGGAGIDAAKVDDVCAAAVGANDHNPRAAVGEVALEHHAGTIG